MQLFLILLFSVYFFLGDLFAGYNTHRGSKPSEGVRQILARQKRNDERANKRDLKAQKREEDKEVKIYLRDLMILKEKKRKEREPWYQR